MTLSGLAEALHMESNYSRPSRDMYERAYMDQFASIQAGTKPIPEFFDADNVSAIFHRAR